MKTLQEISEILKANKAELREKYNVKDIGIFGSYVRGEQKKRSDVDLLVEFHQVPDLLTFLELEGYLEKLLHLNVDLVREKALRPELRDRILNEVVQV